MLPIECEIPSLQFAIELLPATSEDEKFFLYLVKLDETRCITALVDEAHKKHVKARTTEVLHIVFFQKVN